MWVYQQSTGEIKQEDTELLACGYSGKGECKNDPSSQKRHNEGPIPCGTYQIQAPYDTKTHGPFVLPLAPNLDNQMFGRSGFLIHGDSLHDPGTASEGCIILNRAVRERIWESGDHDLKVIV